MSGWRCMFGKKASTQQIEQDLEAVQRLIKAGEYGIADGALISIRERDPFCIRALRLHAMLLAAADDFPEALAAAIILTTVEPQAADHWKLRGKLELELKFKPSAIRSFNKAKEIGDTETSDLQNQAIELD